jgi:hypothetical protein
MMILVNDISLITVILRARKHCVCLVASSDGSGGDHEPPTEAELSLTRWLPGQREFDETDNDPDAADLVFGTDVEIPSVPIGHDRDLDLQEYVLFEMMDLTAETADIEKFLADVQNPDLDDSPDWPSTIH